MTLEKALWHVARAAEELRALDGSPKWDHQGTHSLLTEAAKQATGWDCLEAVARLGRNPELRGPGMLAKPGPHWQRIDGTSARRESHAVRCTRHPINVEPCPQCKADPEFVPPPKDWRDGVEEAIAEAAKKYPHTSRKPYTPKGAKK